MVAALQGILSAVSALLITLNALYAHPTATSTPEVTGIFGPVATTTIATTSLPTLSPVAAVTPLAPVSTPVKPATPVAVTKPLPADAAAALYPNAPSPKLAVALASLKNALVNIICVSNTPAIRSISGSGVIFDPKGLILTNSHVAQYFLLESTLPKGSVSCTIRSGSPAESAYTAKLGYLSSQWLDANPSTLATPIAIGTGEHDFAVLVITGSASPLPLPASFSYVPLSRKELATDQEVAIASYAAQTLTSAQIRSSLYPTLVFGTIRSRFNFNGGTATELVSLGGNAAAQEGSSGGGVANDAGELIGIITTSTQTGPLASRDMRAVTIGHMRTSFKKDSGEDFDVYFTYGDPKEMVSVFVDDIATQGSFLKRSIGL